MEITTKLGLLDEHGQDFKIQVSGTSLGNGRYTIMIKIGDHFVEMSHAAAQEVYRMLGIVIAHVKD